MIYKYGKVIKNSSIPKYLSFFINIRAITLWPFIIFRDEPDIDSLNHERIHIMQQRELFVIPFYILYAAFWLFNKIKMQSNVEAYMNIPFEKEAYMNEGSAYYILNRKRFSWIKYI